MATPPMQMTAWCWSVDEGVLTLVQTVTDADGDRASASVDLGANGVFRFGGRWPQYQCRQCGQRQSAADESNLSPMPAPALPACSPAALAPMGPHLVYSLNVSAAGADSGLNDTATGQTHPAHLESGSVVGRWVAAAAVWPLPCRSTAAGR